MPLKLIPIFLLWLSLNFCESDDWCSLIEPNHRYNGLGIYRRWRSVGESDADYMMFNRAGRQWRFTLKDGVIEMIPNSVENSSDSDVIHRFGLNYKFETKSSKPTKYSSNTVFVTHRVTIDCNVKESENLQNLFCHRLIDNENSTLKHPFTDFPKDSILLKAKPRQTHAKQQGDMIVVVNKARNYTLNLRAFHFNLINTTVCSKKNHINCYRPQFIDALDLQLLGNIDGVVDYELEGESGYLVLFNINGTPKYCFTPEDKGISVKCNSAESMTFLLEDCFPELETPPNIKVPDTRSGGYTVLIAIIVGTICIILIIGLICYVVYTKKSVHSGTTLFTSETTADTPHTSKLNSKANSSAKT